MNALTIGLAVWALVATVFACLLHFLRHEQRLAIERLQWKCSHLERELRIATRELMAAMYLTHKTPEVDKRMREAIDRAKEALR